jgi:UDP-N-acetylglucosamine--dolichyl-phosphate N-acetylglucosaminephosphotransferase
VSLAAIVAAPLFGYALIFLASLFSTYIFSILLIPRLKQFGFTGKDVNKQGRPDVAEMGGISIAVGFTAGVLLAIILNTFDGIDFNIVYVLAGLLTIQALAFIGIIDDLLDIPQWVKAFIPLASAVPLIAVKAAGSTEMAIPLFGVVDFGIFYILLLVPVGVAVASNLTNMLAGFNGMEAGMGAVIFACMALLAFLHGNVEMLVLFLPMLGALLGFLPKNWFPSKVFPGDVGTLPIGAVLATGVIIGNFESAGAMILLLFVADFFIKLANRFPSSNWWGEIKEDGKLYPLGGKVRSLCQLVMKLANGIEEQKLVMLMLGAQLLLGLLVVSFFVQF